MFQRCASELEVPRYFSNDSTNRIKEEVNSVIIKSNNVNVLLLQDKVVYDIHDIYDNDMCASNAPGSEMKPRRTVDLLASNIVSRC